MGTIYRYIQIVPMDLHMELKQSKTHDFENLFIVKEKLRSPEETGVN
jgi:hypothetical protein